MKRQYTDCLFYITKKPNNTSAVSDVYDV